MNILLTGCAGFVGWKTGELLLAAKHSVTGVDNLNDYYSPVLKKWRLKRLEAAGGSDFNFICGDICDGAFTEALFRNNRFDAVINLAARAGVRTSIDEPGPYVSTNILGLVNILEGMTAGGVSKLVQASSSSIYAGQEGPFTEDMKVDQPLSPYAASKKGSEVMAYTFHHLHRIDVSILRFFTVYGPAGRPDMTPLKFTHRIASRKSFPLFGDGEQRRDFTYVDDIASGVVAALKPVGYEIINLGSGADPITMNAMIRLLEKYIGKKAVLEKQPFNPADMMSTSADISKAARLLEWRPQTSYADGFKALVDWYFKEQTWLEEELD